MVAAATTSPWASATNTETGPGASETTRSTMRSARWGFIATQHTMVWQMPALVIRGRNYPVLLPKLSDPRLHLAAVIISLQVLGQVAFGFELSIAQILLAIGTCAVLEVGIAFRRQHVLMWPASAMLTGNPPAFVLPLPR